MFAVFCINVILRYLDGKGKIEYFWEEGLSNIKYLVIGRWNVIVINKLFLFRYFEIK